MLKSRALAMTIRLTARAVASRMPLSSPIYTKVTIRVVITSMLPGIPTMAGIPKQEPAAMNTRRPPARILGAVRGRVTSMRVRSGLAPLMRAASSSVGSIFSIAREMVINAKGE